VNIPYCCRCFSEEVVQILTTFQTVLAPLGLQASAGKQRVLISRPQPNRFIPGQDSACEKSTRVCPALALSRSDKVRKDSHTRLVCPIPATRGLSPNVSPGHWLSVLWNSVLPVSLVCQSPNRHVNALPGVRCPVDLGPGSGVLRMVFLISS